MGHIPPIRGESRRREVRTMAKKGGRRAQQRLSLGVSFFALVALVSLVSSNIKMASWTENSPSPYSRAIQYD